MSDVFLEEGKWKKDGWNKIQPENRSEPAALEDELKKGKGIVGNIYRFQTDLHIRSIIVQLTVEELISFEL